MTHITLHIEPDWFDDAVNRCDEYCVNYISANARTNTIVVTDDVELTYARDALGDLIRKETTT